jgi:hypothetical protein
MTVRPLSEFPAVVSQMGTAAAGLPVELIVPLANNIKREVERQGGRYYVRGRSGAKVRLGAKVQQARIGKAVTASRSVSGEPAGFWRIIEDGSSPHLIAGRRKGGRNRGARAARSQFARNADSFSGSPINIPGVGWRQYAVHPGHGSVGRPWRKAMNQADQIVRWTLVDQSSKALLKAWNK